MSIQIDHSQNRVTQDGSPIWRDMLGHIVSKGSGTGAPTWTPGVGGGAVGAYKFIVGDFVDIVYHVDHDYHPGSSIYMHTHWTASGTSTNTVKWQYTYTIAKGHNQSNFVPAGTVITSELATNGTAWRHMVSETAAISSTELEPDSLIWVNIKRITNGATDNADDIFLLTADIHYQCSYLGTKQKAPNFYV